MTPITNFYDATSRQVSLQTARQELREPVRTVPEEDSIPEDENSKILQRVSLTEDKNFTTLEKLELKEIQQQDRSIREHEQAHLRAARDIGIGQPQFEFKLGADGEKYAIRGEVSIDFSSVAGDAEATIDKAKKIQNAALAPSDPSPQDLQAASQARIMENKAHRKLAREKLMELDMKKEEEEQFQQNPGVKAYDAQLNFQRNLNNILDLFS